MFSIRFSQIWDNLGRYYAPNPDDDLVTGYDDRDVVVENLRKLCVHRVANAFGLPWVWWDYVVDYHLRCSMKVWTTSTTAPTSRTSFGHSVHALLSLT
jgi:hypothetical protein